MKGSFLAQSFTVSNLALLGLPYNAFFFFFFLPTPQTTLDLLYFVSCLALDLSYLLCSQPAMS